MNKNKDKDNLNNLKIKKIIWFEKDKEYFLLVGSEIIQECYKYLQRRKLKKDKHLTCQWLPQRIKKTTIFFHLQAIKIFHRNQIKIMETMPAINFLQSHLHWFHRNKIIQLTIQGRIAQDKRLNKLYKDRDLNRI